MRSTCENSCGSAGAGVGMPRTLGREGGSARRGTMRTFALSAFVSQDSGDTEKSLDRRLFGRGASSKSSVLMMGGGLREEEARKTDICGGADFVGGVKGAVSEDAESGGGVGDSEWECGWRG
jgi:hypothetical protein